MLVSSPVNSPVLIQFQTNACWVFFHAFVVVCHFFSKIGFLKNISGTLSECHPVGPDLDQKLFVFRLSGDDKSPC